MKGLSEADFSEAKPALKNAGLLGIEHRSEALKGRSIILINVSLILVTPPDFFKLYAGLQRLDSH